MLGNLEAAAKLLGATIMPGNSDNHKFIVFGDPSKWESLKLSVYRSFGAPLDMLCIKYWSDKTFWRDGKLTLEYNKYHEDCALHINVNVTRPVQTLANDINRRLVIPALEVHANNVAATHRYMDYTAKMLAFGREFGDMNEEDRAVRVYANRDYSELAELILITDKDATLNLRLPHDKMRKIINFIKSEVLYD
jgi:hypothetical protein